MKPTVLYDAIIIGGGPGGLSTALGLGRQNRTCLVISNKKYRNDGIKASHAVLGHDHVHPQTILAQSRKQIERYNNTTYAEAEIISARKQLLSDFGSHHEGYAVVGEGNQEWFGKTLVLATGVKDILPDLAGYKENWPSNIYQCLFCDGWERRGSDRAVLCLPTLGMHEVANASMLLGQNARRNADGSATVTILANGPWDIATAEPSIAKQVKILQARGVTIDQRKVIKLESAHPQQEMLYVYLQDEASGAIERRWYGFLFHKPATEPNARHLINQLGLDLEKGPFGDHLKTNGGFQATSLSGVFAAGDTGNAKTHVTTALSSGLFAAAGVTQYLNEIDGKDALSAAEGIEIDPEHRLLN